MERWSRLFTLREEKIALKKIKYIIIFLVILIIIILGILLWNKKSLTGNGNQVTYRNDVEETIATPLEKEKLYGSYMLVDDLINNFFLYINGQDQRINNELAAYSLLDDEFVQENNITEKNIVSFFEKYKGFASYATINMYKKEITNYEEVANTFFYVKGVIRKEGAVQNVYILLKQDHLNQTYNILFLTEQDFQKIINDQNNVIQKKVKIPNKEYNKTYVKSSSDYDICLKHMQDYKNALNNNEKEAYERLDETYRNKRFGSLENFQQYRKEKQETLGKENFTQYLVNSYSSYTQYICKDMYGNLYIFEEKDPMEYTLKLDTYTIPTEKFKEEYRKGTVQTKVQMNIDKFRLMINNQDYKSAYSVLSESFKNNYFKTQEDFEEYVKANAYRYNEIKFESFEKQGNTYICKAYFSDLTKGLYQDESKGTGGSGYIYDWNFVVQLGEDLEFTLSFEVK